MIFCRTCEHSLPVPKQSTDGAAGYDLPLYAPNGVTLWEGGQLLVHTGWSVVIPEGYVGLIRPRSGLAVRFGVDVGAGVIDCDYRGEIQVLLTRLPRSGCSTAPFTINHGERIAQMVVVPYLRCEPSEVDKLPDTVRGAGGFGSTG
jgi:dUTP pyrophosphatase